MRVVPLRSLVVAALAAAASRRAYRLLTSGALTLDLGVGRRTRPLGPVGWEIRADRETVFDVVAGPYLGPTPRALAGKLEVWERGSDMVLAAHFTKVRCGVTTTVETVRFTRPDRIDFRVVRGPVPHLMEAFLFEDAGGGATRLTWVGELGTDLGALGAWWGDRVAHTWEHAVRESLRPVIAEAQRRSRAS